MTVSTAIHLPLAFAYNIRCLPLHYFDTHHTPRYVKKMAKTYQTATSKNLRSDCESYTDEDSSTVAAHEHIDAKSQGFLNGSEIFRRRMDASDEILEQFWIINRANPIVESEDDVEADEPLGA
jgi:hypothetical protein